MKTGPSVTDAAMGRIAQGTKVLAEGGYEKIFRQTFDTIPEEQLLKSYACYLSTSAGPVMGILYLSTAKLAFCSDNPLPYKVGDQTEWSYYKVFLHIIHSGTLKCQIANKSSISHQISFSRMVSGRTPFLDFDVYITYQNSLNIQTNIIVEYNAPIIWSCLCTFLFDMAVSFI